MEWKPIETSADPDCPGCRGGDKVPASGYFRCPVCDAEWPDETPTPPETNDG